MLLEEKQKADGSRAMLPTIGEFLAIVLSVRRWYASYPIRRSHLILLYNGLCKLSQTNFTDWYYPFLEPVFMH